MSDLSLQSAGSRLRPGVVRVDGEWRRRSCQHCVDSSRVARAVRQWSSGHEIARVLAYRSAVRENFKCFSETFTLSQFFTAWFEPSIDSFEFCWTTFRITPEQQGRLKARRTVERSIVSLIDLTLMPSFKTPAARASTGLINNSRYIFMKRRANSRTYMYCTLLQIGLILV